ncbi:MAG: hypothetical protein RL207_2031 [Bacteroidota bacterium]
MVHSWYIYKMIEQLKQELEKVFGQKVEKRRECEALALDLYTKTGMVISYNTLRRLFGIIEFREPRLSTLDALSKYIGFSSYYDFTHRFRAVDEWPKWENLFFNIDQNDINELMNMFTYRLSQKDDFTYSFTVLLRELIYRRDLASLKVILANEAWSFRQLPYENALKIGVVIGRLFRFVNDDTFEKELLKLPLFRDLVLKMFVDYSGLNKKYGMWISYVNELPAIDEESLIFTNGVLIWKDLLNGRQITSEHLQRIPHLSVDLHPILYGRIAALHLMTELSVDERTQIYTDWSELIKKHPERTLEYIFVSNVQCLVFPTMEFSNFLYSCEKHASNVHFWYNRSQLNVYYLSLLQHAIFAGETKKAKNILQQIDLSYLRYGYDEFLLLFVYLFEHELCIDPTEKEERWEQLLNHASYLNYPIFTEEYFKGYFNRV